MKVTLQTLAKAGAFATAFASLTFFSACKKSSDNGPSTITVSSVKSGSTDLNGATPATNVSVSDNIVVTFSDAVDAATANSTNITLKTTDGASTAATAITTSGAAVTIDPTADLMTGANYTLSIGAGVKGAKGATFSAKTVTFTTAGPKTVTPPQAASQILYLNFNGNTTPVTGGNPDAAIGVTYANDRGGNANAAAKFDGTTTILEWNDGTSLFNSSQTFSYWLNLDTTAGHGHWVMGMDAFYAGQMEFDGNANNFKHAGAFLKGTVYNADSLTKPDAWTGEAVGDRGGITTFANRPANGYKSVFAGKWAHVVYSFDASTKTRAIYVNGQPVLKQNFNQAVAGNYDKNVTRAAYTHKADNPTDLSNGFAIGFAKTRAAGLWATETWGGYDSPTANHLKGMLDDFRVFNVALTDAEVLTLYNAEK